MEKPKQITLDDRLDSSSYLIAGAVGVGSGALATAATIHREFQADIENIPEVSDHYKGLEKELNVHWGKASSMERKPFLKELAEIKENGSKRLATLLDEHHFRGKTFWQRVLGTFDRSYSMSRNSRSDVLINSAFTAAIAFGGALMFFNNRHARKQIDQINQQLDEQKTTAGRG